MARTRIRRNTPQRQVILEELQKLHTHPSALELYDVVRGRLPRISLGTVYRNLDVLCEDGLAHRLELAGSDTRFDAQLDEHDHVRCTGCGLIGDLHGDDRPPRPLPPTEAAGFRVDGLRLEYFGVCPECQQRD